MFSLAHLGPATGTGTLPSLSQDHKDRRSGDKDNAQNTANDRPGNGTTVIRAVVITTTITASTGTTTTAAAVRHVVFAIVDHAAVGPTCA